MKKKKQKRVERYEKWVYRVLKQLRKPFYVQEYEWSHTVHKEEAENVCAASITINIKYLNYHINIYPNVKKFYDKGSYKDALGILIHEMSHLYTEPLYLFAIDACTNTNKDHLETIREQQTQRICGCIQELLPYKEYKPIIK